MSVITKALLALSATSLASIIGFGFAACWASQSVSGNLVDSAFLSMFVFLLSVGGLAVSGLIDSEL